MNFKTGSFRCVKYIEKKTNMVSASLPILFNKNIKKCVPVGTYHEYLPGGSLRVLSKKTKTKYDFEDSISNVDLSSAAK